MRARRVCGVLVALALVGVSAGAGAAQEDGDYEEWVDRQARERDRGRDDPGLAGIELASSGRARTSDALVPQGTFASIIVGATD